MPLPGYIAAPALLIQIKGVLDGLTYTAHPKTGDVPDVFQDGPADTAKHEQIVLSSDVDVSDIEWQELGGLLIAESHVFTITVRSEVPCGYTGIEALARADALSRIVQDGFRDATTGLPTGLVDEDGVFNVVDNYHFESGPMRTTILADSGYGAQIELNFRVNTRH